jgi:hypothetical protein
MRSARPSRVPRIIALGGLPERHHQDDEGDEKD